MVRFDDQGHGKPQVRVEPLAFGALLGSNRNAIYPDACIPPPPPDLDCGEINYTNFTVLAPDPHRFDGDRSTSDDMDGWAK